MPNSLVDITDVQVLLVSQINKCSPIKLQLPLILCLASRNHSQRVARGLKNGPAILPTQTHRKIIAPVTTFLVCLVMLPVRLERMITEETLYQPVR